MTGGDAALFVELLDTFLTDADQYLGELDAAVAAGDHAALQRPAHSLKSNALNVGATRLAELSRSLEQEARGRIGHRRRRSGRGGAGGARRSCATRSHRSGGGGRWRLTARLVGRVLIVDDGEMNRKVLRAALERGGARHRAGGRTDGRRSRCWRIGRSTSCCSTL
jgi:hypothetical protein